MRKSSATVKIVALIPARAGSKSLPNKNIRMLAGKPLIAHSIECALQSQRIQRTLVSTDSPQIKELAVSFGAEAPFLRPARLAKDYSRDIGFVRHALDWMEREGDTSEKLIVLLRPTEPYRDPKIVDAAIDMLMEHRDWHSLRSISLADQTPYKMWRRKGKGLVPVVGWKREELYNMPRQLLPRVYWQNGYVDLCWSSTVRKFGSITGKHVLGFEIDQTFNIDTLEDLERARRPKARRNRGERHSS